MSWFHGATAPGFVLFLAAAFVVVAVATWVMETKR